MAKSFKGKKFTNKSGFKISITNEMLYNMFSYSLNIYEHPLINKKSLSNLGKMLDLIDEKEYELTNINSYILLKVIKEIIKVQLEEKIVSYSLLKQNIIDKLGSTVDGIDDLFIDAENSEEMTTDEISYINKFVEERLTYSYMFIYRDKFKEIFDKLDTTDNLEYLNKIFVSTLENAFSDVKNAQADSECVINDFDLFDRTKTETVIDNTIRELNKPNNKLLMGIKKFNELLNGGLENGRLYLACGVPKSFKSGTLLNMCIWACKYNKNFSLKNPNKRPTVFYLTQENSVRETLDRTYYHLTGKSIKTTTTKAATDLILKELGINGVNLVIKYRPNKSISTLDMDNMISEVEADGNEVILMVQDYTKRIRSSNYSSDLRIELGNVSDDFCNIAKARNIPIVSGCQLNRRICGIIE